MKLSLSLLLLRGVGAPWLQLLDEKDGRSVPTGRRFFKKNALFLALALLLVIPPMSGIAGVKKRVAADKTLYVNMVQNNNYDNGTDITNTVLMRYPCGRIGLWSVNDGEIVDVVTRGVILYPCIDTVVVKDNSDWRSSFSGDPSIMTAMYKDNVPARGSSVDLTVTPNVSIYRYHFKTSSKFNAIVFKVGPLKIDNSEDWNNQSFTVVDSRTAEVTLSNGRLTVYFYVKFNVPCSGYGTIDGSNLSDGLSSVSGAQVGGYFKFDPDTSEVIASVAMSMTSMTQAQSYFDSEFGSMDFDGAVSNLKQAWVDKLSEVEVQSSDSSMLKEFYTALYTLYADMFDAKDQPYYGLCSGSMRLLTIGSSDYWQYVNGYARCEWDLARQVYPFLALVDPDAYRDNINTIQSQFDRDGQIYCDWHLYAGNGGGMPAEYTGYEATLAHLFGIPDGSGGIDYSKLLSSLKAQMANYTPEFWSCGYNPTDGPMTANQTSRGLEQYATLKGVGVFARMMGDSAAYDEYYPWYSRYTNLWKPDVQRFCGKTKNGNWSDTGFFEGDGTSYRFMTPQDPYGILNLLGADNAVSLIDNYVRNQSDYNDYKLNYEFLPVFADRADVTQDLVKNHIATFVKDGNFTMYEGLWGGNGLTGQGAFYVDNAVPLAACILGLWWTGTSGGTYLITAPSVDSYVIHGVKDLTVRVSRVSPGSHYIKAIKLDGNNYPCYQLSAITLAVADHTLDISLADAPSKLGALYLSSSDGEVTACTGDLSTYLDFTIDPLAAFCTAKVFSVMRPTTITLGGEPFNGWTYDTSSGIVTLDSVSAGSYHISIDGAAIPPGQFKMTNPPDGAARMATDPTFAWTKSPRALSYTLVVDNDSDFSSPLFDQDVGFSTSRQVTGLANLTTYYWKVIAHNSYGDTTAASGSSSFKTTDAPQIIEAEDMTLTNYVVNTNSSASGGSLIKLAGAGLTGDAVCSFPDSSGIYDLKVFYYDENDGACTFNVYVGGEKLATWVANQDLGSPDPVAQTRTSRTIEGIEIDKGTQFRLEAVQNNQEWGRYDDIEITPTITKVNAPPGTGPAGFRLEQNYPNPFNPTTNIAYELPGPSKVHLAIYDAMGRRIRILIDEEQSPGYHSLLWNGTDDSGREVASGLYFYRISASGSGKVFLSTQKMLLLK